MGKVGIATFMRADRNYGAALQAFALQFAIREIGHAPALIDFNNTPPRPLASIRGVASRLRTGVNYFTSGECLISSRPRAERFGAFAQEHFSLTRPYEVLSEVESSPPDCDAIVCGSDQIWNPHGKRPGVHRYFLLDFARPGQKRISYAPSFCADSIPEGLVDAYQKALRKFDHLSVRETQGRDLVKRLTGQDAQVVLDPTLLLSAEQWGAFAKPYPHVEAPYILCHMIEDAPELLRMAKELKRETGYPIVVLGGSNWRKFDSDVHHALDTGPAEFVGLYQNAACVLTKSFHGTAFAVIHRKPFWSFVKTGRGNQHHNARLITLLDRLGLCSRLIFGDAPLPAAPLDIDYDEPGTILEQEREKSWAFLSNALASKQGSTT